MNNLELRTINIPAARDSPEAADFVAMAEVRNAIYRDLNGNEDETRTTAELLPSYRPNPDKIRHLWLILADGLPVGRIGVDIPLEEGSRSAYWLIEILRSHWGRGIGTTALPVVERCAQEHGRSLLQSWAQHVEPALDQGHGEKRLASPTGFSSVAQDHAARFYLRHGYELGQIERKSCLPLNGALPGIERELAEARPDGYSLVHWRLPTPELFVKGYARMKARMSTDVPSGAMEYDEERWDAARVDRHDQVWLDGGHTLLVAAARHDASGELVAYTELAIGADRSTPTNQIDTLVLREHRGHGLGRWLKLANLLAWRAIAPGSPRVLTWNAEENRHMLDVNEAMGFVPIASIGAWRKEISLPCGPGASSA